MNDQACKGGVAVYGSTQRESFPLILILGRESNSEFPFDGVDEYKFKDFLPRGFWNRSYEFVSRATQQSSKWLREQVKARNSSPIVFGNVLPIAILNKDKRSDKTPIRKRVPRDKIEEHLKWILHEAFVPGRIKLILYSVGTNFNIPEAREELLKAVDGRITVIELPYFANFTLGDNALDNALKKPEEKNKIVEIVERWSRDLASAG